MLSQGNCWIRSPHWKLISEWPDQKLVTGFRTGGLPRLQDVVAASDGAQLEILRRDLLFSLSLSLSLAHMLSLFLSSTHKMFEMRDCTSY